MKREYHKWFSSELGRDMEMLIFGHDGLPAVVFPTSQARFYEFEDRGMVAAVQDRIENIRRGTALDPKSIFYVPVQESPAELRRVIDGVLAVMYNSSIEYYRDLGRHAKKKRSRGIIPQPTLPPTSGTSSALSLSDWNFRYDFKAGILAEFRQEADRDGFLGAFLRLRRNDAGDQAAGHQQGFDKIRCHADSSSRYPVR